MYGYSFLGLNDLISRNRSLFLCPLLSLREASLPPFVELSRALDLFSLCSQLRSKVQNFLGLEIATPSRVTHTIPEGSTVRACGTCTSRAR
jgi:hypothetical protein